jgi:hypothetical protein
MLARNADPESVWQSVQWQMPARSPVVANPATLSHPDRRAFLSRLSRSKVEHFFSGVDGQLDANSSNAGSEY